MYKYINIIWKGLELINTKVKSHYGSPCIFTCRRVRTSGIYSCVEKALDPIAQIVSGDHAHRKQNWREDTGWTGRKYLQGCLLWFTHHNQTHPFHLHSGTSCHTFHRDLCSRHCHTATVSQCRPLVQGSFFLEMSKSDASLAKETRRKLHNFREGCYKLWSAQQMSFRLGQIFGMLNFEHKTCYCTVPSPV